MFGGIHIRSLLVVFGGTGDLAHRKIYSAIYNLHVSGQLPKNFALVSIGRKDKTEESFRNEAAASINQFTRSNSGAEKDISQVVSSFYYQRIDFTQSEDYQKLKEYLDALDGQYKTNGNRIFYLAVAPEHFSTIVQNLSYSGMADQSTGYKRIVIEKPFGKDLESAKELNSVITRVFHEDAIYRIDHYLGKEMLQNIMVIRFANVLFEPLWNNKYIDHIQITSSETVGVENRGGYYENAGALRDMMQNHMLQLLMLTAMEAPVSLDTNSVRDEKVKVLKAISKMDRAKISENVVRGQYGEGMVMGKQVKGYRMEDRVSRESNTETYMAMKVEIENLRWAGVPFYLRTGKRLPVKTTKIVVQFLPMPEILYYKEFGNLEANRLIIEIQPREGIVLRLNGKKPGFKNVIIPAELDFCQNCAAGEVSPDAYERLLMDIMAGDSTLFTRWDEVEYSWKLMDSVSKDWNTMQPVFPNYAAGTWGPSAADDLLRRDGRSWVND
jgi:glucose-6-phosphate 1-dehydrogenase